MAGTCKHPARLTADRLLSHAARWQDRLSPPDLAALAAARKALLRIAAEDGARGAPAVTISVGTQPST